MINQEGSQAPPSEFLQEVLVLDPPPVFKFHGDELLEKFNILKAWESPLPLDQFLTIHARSVRALLVSGTYRLTADILRLLPSPKFIFTTSSGLNHIDYRRAIGKEFLWPVRQSCIQKMLPIWLSDCGCGFLLDLR